MPEFKKNNKALLVDMNAYSRLIKFFLKVTK